MFTVTLTTPRFLWAGAFAPATASSLLPVPCCLPAACRPTRWSRPQPARTAARTPRNDTATRQYERKSSRKRGDTMQIASRNLQNCIELDRLSNTAIATSDVQDRCYMPSLRSDAAHHTHPRTNHGRDGRETHGRDGSTELAEVARPTWRSTGRTGRSSVEWFTALGSSPPPKEAGT